MKTAICQTYEEVTYAQSFATPKALHSRLKVPSAPQFWVELGEAVVNWLARILKMVEEKPIEERAYREIVVDQDDFAKTIWEHVARYRDQNGENPHAVLMGPDYYRDLIGDIRYAFDFRCEFRYAHRYERNGFMGVRIFCLPWMKGMLCVPDLTKP